MESNYYSREELLQIGFKEVGKEVFLSRKASIYGASRISIGSYVRIDDFCIISGNVTIGSYVHIAAYSALYGGSDKAGIELDDFVTISSRNAIYAATDNYYGEGLSNPLFDADLRCVYESKVVMEKHALLGAGCTVLPGAKILEGTSIGAMSLIKDVIGPWGVYVGVPSRIIGKRSKKLLDLEECARIRMPKYS